MLFKVFILSCLACLSTRVAAKQSFECLPESPNNVFIYGIKVECPKDQICNFKGCTGGTPFSPCEPCVDSKKVCAKGDYTCKSKTTFQLKDVLTINKCPPFTECDDSGADCLPCKALSCEEADVYWTCEGEFVITATTKGYCPPGMACNKNNEFPCAPCIADENGGIIPVNSGTRTLFTYSFMIMSFILGVFQMY
ncbi:uncharacterized protein [Atheta coriaria]|uniref:uncharacterized protein n=1 Tax=Dalotia coriaria TaxID=877792 RepID=UPI0031F4176F